MSLVSIKLICIKVKSGKPVHAFLRNGLSHNYVGFYTCKRLVLMDASDSCDAYLMALKPVCHCGMPIRRHLLTVNYEYVGMPS